MRRCIALGGVLLILLAVALPAQAGLGDLFDEVLDNPVQDLTAPLAPVVSAVPIVAELTETLDEVVAPVVTLVDEVASPVVTLVDEVASPVTEVVDQVASPIVDVIEPVVGVVEPVVEDNDLIPDVKVDPIPSPNVPPVIDGRPTVISPTFEEPTFDQVPTADPPSAGQRATVVRSSQRETVQRLLLTSISGSTRTLVDREPNDTLASTPIDSGWLTSLGDWLSFGIAGLLDVLAIPMRLLELLLRALLSAGAGLVAPAAILGALAVGGRRRLLPVS